MVAHIPTNHSEPTKLDFNLLQEAASIVKDNWQAYALFTLLSIWPLAIALIGFQILYFTTFFATFVSTAGTHDSATAIQGIDRLFSLIGLVNLIAVIVMSFVGGGAVRMTLLALQGKKIEFKDGFGAGLKFPRLAGAALVIAFLAFIGVCVCFVGTPIVVTISLLTFPVLMNEDLSITASVQRSAELLKGQSILAFVIFFVAQIVVNFSAVAFYVPMLVTVPWLFVVITLMYRNLAGLPQASKTQIPE